MREPDISDETVARRAAYLEANGWVATTSSMGDAGTAEFVVSETLIRGDGASLAVGIMPSERSDVTLTVPEEVGDCADDELVRGYQPDEALAFKPGSGLRIGW